ncbi:exodeoxyribonuclease V subunit alpha [Luteimonas marina]|uniref:RecBCD enzyme subunit RecD n=1 Tax=Luteimonas marina TaxID=488485 RepID=A0A5C5U9K4_9GAMM|nr:exodeoxyribonuclease V subunit alpha [Luteimonas marina]TWT22325.1 exodeoxyribonuclease V subunit alpha [Luteimonas marina]
MSLLDALFRGGHLRTLDHALAQSLRRLDPSTPDAVLAAAALASLAVSKGHAGLQLDRARDLLDGDDPAIAWPDAGDWQRQLAASRWVAAPVDPVQPSDTQAPLVLEGAHGAPDLLYLRRYREYERALALGLQRIGVHAPDAVGLDVLAPLFAQLFPQVPGKDRQALAAATALRHNLVLITGGPGTGKTTTIARLLVLLAAQALQDHKPAPRIALAAPTGRAAERMADSVRNALQSLTAAGIAPELLAQLPTTGTTLHRLLGTLPDSPRFRHHADHPLPFDVVVVDEASMIDLPLMAKLVDAVADGAKLVLLGDPDQLPSVEAGDVLSGILRAVGNGERITAEDATALQPLLNRHPREQSRHPREGGDPASLLPNHREEGNPDIPRNAATPTFPARRIHLQRGWRQDESLHLAPLATAVREGNSDTALSLLRSGTLSNVHFHEALADPLQTHRDQLLAHWQSLAEAATPAQALALAGRLRILTAVREGPQGARTLNARIEELLAGPSRRGSRPASNKHFHGQLLIVTENSYRHRLFNGDIGICQRDANGALMAWFPGDQPDAPRAFHPAALPAHDSAFAMTVHKAQGSEFDTVWLLLPARSNRVLSRELVYTGITRARRELHVAGSAEVLRDALARHASRWSGLGRRLGSETVRWDPALQPTMEGGGG